MLYTKIFLYLVILITLLNHQLEASYLRTMTPAPIWFEEIKDDDFNNNLNQSLIGFGNIDHLAKTHGHEPISCENEIHLNILKTSRYCHSDKNYLTFSTSKVGTGTTTRDLFYFSSGPIKKKITNLLTNSSRITTRHLQQQTLKKYYQDILQNKKYYLSYAISKYLHEIFNYKINFNKIFNISKTTPPQDPIETIKSHIKELSLYLNLVDETLDQNIIKNLSLLYFQYEREIMFFDKRILIKMIKLDSIEKLQFKEINNMISALEKIKNLLPGLSKNPKTKGHIKKIENKLEPLLIFLYELKKTQTNLFQAITKNINLKNLYLKVIALPATATLSTPTDSVKHLKKSILLDLADLIQKTKNSTSQSYKAVNFYSKELKSILKEKEIPFVSFQANNVEKKVDDFIESYHRCNPYGPIILKKKDLEETARFIEYFKNDLDILRQTSGADLISHTTKLSSGNLVQIERTLKNGTIIKLPNVPFVIEYPNGGIVNYFQKENNITSTPDIQVAVLAQKEKTNYIQEFTSIYTLEGYSFVLAPLANGNIDELIGLNKKIIDKITNGPINLYTNINKLNYQSWNPPLIKLKYFDIIFQSLLNGLIFLKKQRIAHRNLTPKNIYYYRNEFNKFSHAAIGNFRNALVINKEKWPSIDQLEHNDSLYQAPIGTDSKKIAINDNNFQNNDIFSIGLILTQLLAPKEVLKYQLDRKRQSLLYFHENPTQKPYLLKPTIDQVNRLIKNVASSFSIKHPLAKQLLPRIRIILQFLDPNFKNRINPDDALKSLNSILKQEQK